MVLTIPVHNLKQKFPKKCLEQVDRDLQYAGVAFDAMGWDNALVNSQMVQKIGIHVTESTQADGTSSAEHGCFFELIQDKYGGFPILFTLCKTFATILLGNHALVQVFLHGVGTVDPAMLHFLLMHDTQSKSGLRVVPGQSRKVINPTAVERQKVGHRLLFYRFGTLAFEQGFL